MLRISGSHVHALPRGFSAPGIATSRAGNRIFLPFNKVQSTPKSGSSQAMVSEATAEDKGVDLRNLLAYVDDAGNFTEKHRPQQFNIQILLEKVIIDCRFFTLLAIVGSLVGSVLCFVEGCVLTLESYFHYFNSLSQISNSIQVVPILIEAIDMFLVGSAMFTFGMALHVMFVGQQKNLSNFSLQKFPAWIGMESPMQAKSKIGYALMMILQVQVLEKFKNIPVNNVVDLAYFAVVVFLSSSSIFILSRTYAENRISEAKCSRSEH